MQLASGLAGRRLLPRHSPVVGHAVRPSSSRLALPRGRRSALQLQCMGRPKDSSPAGKFVPMPDEELVAKLKEDALDFGAIKREADARGVSRRGSKDNARIRLLTEVQQSAGMWDPPAATPTKPPDVMSTTELREVLAARGVAVPGSRDRMVVIATGLLVAEGKLPAAEDGGGRWERLKLAELREECRSRGLRSYQGSRDTLIQRLMQWEAAQRLEAATGRPLAGAAGGGGGRGWGADDLLAPPVATHPVKLVDTREQLAQLDDLPDSQLLAMAQAKGLDQPGKDGEPWQYDRAAVIRRLRAGLERMALRYMGGRRRLFGLAQNAVASMTEARQAQEAAARRVPLPDLAAVADESEAARLIDKFAERLAEAICEEWLAWALSPLRPEPEPEPAGASDSESESDRYDVEPLRPDAPPAFARAGDPALSVALLVGGDAPAARAAALASAREAALALQGDPHHGQVPAWAHGEGWGRSGLAVQVYWAEGGGSYRQLSWEEVNSAGADALAARFALEAAAAPGGGGGAPALSSLQEVVRRSDVVLPLWQPCAEAAGALAGAEANVAGSAFGAEASRLAADRAQLAAALGARHYAPAALTALELSDFLPAGGGAPGSLEDVPAFQKLTRWLEQLGSPPDLARVAVRAERGGALLGAALARGAGEALRAALAVMAGASTAGAVGAAPPAPVTSVLVELAHEDATFFTVPVVGGPGGAVALPPVASGYYDVEDELAAGEHEQERWLAVQEGFDGAVAAAMLRLAREGQTAHPAHLGRPAGRSQRPRHSVPPLALSVEACAAVRDTATRLFQDLGLRDYACFSGWVVPDGPGSALEVVVRASAEAEGRLRAGQPAGGTGSEWPGGRAPGPLADVIAEDEAAARTSIVTSGGEHASSAHAPAADAAPARSGELALGRPPEWRLADEVDQVLPQGDPTTPIRRYGTWETHGFAWDVGSDATRLETQEEYWRLFPEPRPIPEESPPYPTVGALPDLCAQDPSILCRAGNVTVRIGQLSLVPDLSDPAGPAFQAAAAAGVTHEALLRLLVSSAAARAGLPALPAPPQVDELAPSAAEAPGGEEGEAGGGEDAAHAEWAALPPASQRPGPPGGVAWLPGHEPALPVAGYDPSDMAPEAVVEVHATHVLDLSRYDAWLAPFREETERGWDMEEAQAYLAQRAERAEAAAAEAPGAGSEPGEWRLPLPAAGPYGGAPLPYEELWGEASMGVAPAADLDGALADASLPTLGSFAAGDGADGWGLDVALGGGGGTADGRAPPGRQTVWVLLGGGGPGADASVAAGLHALRALGRDPGMSVHAFLLECPEVGLSEEQQRRELFARRLDMLRMGASEEELASEYPEWTLRSIRTPPPYAAALESRGVWALAGSGLLRGAADDLQVACEAALYKSHAAGRRITALDGANEYDGHALLLAEAAQQLELAGVPRDGSVWGRRVDAARVLGDCDLAGLRLADVVSLRDWAQRAAAEGAVVLLTLRSGERAALGQLQRLLDEAGVAYTGPSAAMVEQCADTAAMLDWLEAREVEARHGGEQGGIQTPPRHKMSAPELAAAVSTPERADSLYAQLSAHLGAQHGLWVRPAAATGDAALGVVRACCGADLAVYSQALADWWPALPEELLSAAQGAGGAGDGGVPLPLPPPAALLLEPYPSAEPLRFRDGALEWPSVGSAWLPISACLVGEQGRMQCLGPSTRVLRLADTPPPSGGAGAAAAAAADAEAALAALEPLLAPPEDEAGASGGEEEPEYGRQRVQRQGAAAAGAGPAAAAAAAGAVVGAFDLTPLPEAFVEPYLVQVARVRLQLVADALGLSGAARVDGYMHTQTGEVAVRSVDALPDLAPGSLLFQQAALERCALGGGDVLRELLRGAAGRAGEADLLPAMAPGVRYADLGPDDDVDDHLGGDTVEPAWPASEPLDDLSNVESLL